MRFPFSLVDDWSKYVPPSETDLEDSQVYLQHYLTSVKLGVLWNLNEKQARFIIISKMQTPFHIRSDFYNTFRDEPEYLLYDYEVTTRLNRLEQELAETNLTYAKEPIAQGKNDEAENVLKRIIELEADFIEVWTELGDLYVTTGQPEKAKKLFKETREERPDFTKSWLAYGVTLEKMGEFEQAQKVYAETIEMESRRIDPVESIRQMVEVNPEVPEAWKALGKFLDFEGLEDEADEAKRKAKEKRKPRERRNAGQGSGETRLHCH